MGGDPITHPTTQNNNQTMTQSKFSTDLGEQLNELFKLDKRVFEPASKKDAEYLKRLSKGEENFLQEADVVMAFDQVKTTYDESDATTLSIRANPNGLLINENLQGSIASDTLIINVRTPYGVHENISYWTVVEGGSGNDIIINNHQDSSGSITQMVRAVGGRGVDHYVALAGEDESFMAVMGMEVGETLTVAPEYGVMVEPLDGYFQIQSTDGIMKADLIMDSANTLMQLHDQNGNNVFVCVPEQ